MIIHEFHDSTEAFDGTKIILATTKCTVRYESGLSTTDSFSNQRWTTVLPPILPYPPSSLGPETRKKKRKKEKTINEDIPGPIF
jgi:hypothetical protein